MKFADLITDRAVVLAAAAGWVFCLVKGLI